MSAVSSVTLELSGDGLVRGANTAEPTTFVVTATSNGQPANLSANPLRVEVLSPNGKEVQSNVTASGQSQWTVTYQATEKGSYDVNVYLKSSVKVGIAVGTDASKTKVFGPGLEDGVQDNLPTYFTIEARGTDGQPMGKGGDPFEVKVKGPKGDVPATVTDNGDGTYRVDYAPQDAGPHRVDVTLKNKPVANSPYTVNVKEGADHNTSLVENYQFTIRARTKRNQNMARGGEKFTATVSGPKGPVENKLTDNQNGSYTVDYSLPEGVKGTYNFSVKVNSKDIQGSPWTQNI